MTKLTTDTLKKLLTEQGFSNLKRISKRKNAEKNIVREFSSDQGNFEVVSNSSDSMVITINSSVESVASKTLPTTEASSLVPLINIKKEDFLKYLKDEEIEMEDQIDLSEAKEILAITSVCLPTRSDPSIFDLRDYESFLIKMNNGEIFVFNNYYGIFQSLKEESIQTKNNLTGIYINADLELEWDAAHIKMEIPKNTYTLWLHPEYMQLIFISSDLSKGLTTSTCSNEASVCVNNKELAKIADVDLKDDDCFTSTEVKKLKKYDFVNHHN